MRHLSRLAGVSALALFSVVGLAGAPAHAQKLVRGQGATLPAGLYVDWFNPPLRNGYDYTYNAPLPRPGGGSIPANTGSGAGKAAFESHTFNNNTWFPGGPGTPAQPLPSDIKTKVKEDIQFAGSDAILTTLDLDNYNLARWGDPIQVPSVGTPVTLAFNKASLTLTRRGPTGVANVDTGAQSNGDVLYLSRASYCGIFTGQITNWNHPRIVADNGVAPSNQPIKIVVRSDGSGTTEIFSRHLDTVCDGSADAGGYTFIATNTSDPSTPTGRTTIPWADFISPSRLIFAAGSGGVSTQVAANDFAIGYVSPDYTDLVETPAPGSGVPAPATANLQNQSDINRGRNNVYKHSATWTNVRTGQAGVALPSVNDSALLWGQKLAITDPLANNPVAGDAYPIVGFTFLDFYTCYPKNRVVAVQSFVNYFTGNGTADIEAQRAGFAPLSAKLKGRVRDRLTATGSSPRGLTEGPVASYCSL